jgi:hypothetical protein
MTVVCVAITLAENILIMKFPTRQTVEPTIVFLQAGIPPGAAL